MALEASSASGERGRSANSGRRVLRQSRPKGYSDFVVDGSRKSDLFGLGSAAQRRKSRQGHASQVRRDALLLRYRVPLPAVADQHAQTFCAEAVGARDSRVTGPPTAHRARRSPAQSLQNVALGAILQNHFRASSYSTSAGLPLPRKHTASGRRGLSGRNAAHSGLSPSIRSKAPRALRRVGAID